MPRTIPTTIGPNPTDRRVLQLEQLLNVSRPHAVGVVVMSWAWLHAEQTEGVVPGMPTMLDSVVDIAGAGQALVDAGLVGVSPDGLVLPLELRRQAERAARSDESPADRRRRKDAERKAKSRRNQRLTKPALKSPSPSPTTEDTGHKRTPRRLGDVEGFPVMLLWSRLGVPFYKLSGAQPDEVTGTVTDPEKPSFADALVSLHAAMKRKAGKGLGDPTTMRPTPEAVLSAAERYRAALEASATDDARRDEANRAAAEASTDDQDDIDHEPAERDLSHLCPPAEADSVTSPHPCPQSGHSGVAASPYGRQDLGAESCPHECPQSGHNPAPSSSSVSSVSVSSEQSSKKNTTTTSSVTDAERDYEDRILDRLAPRVDQEQAKQQERHRIWLERVATALGTTADAVKYQRTRVPDILLTRIKAAGLDPKTGEPVNADAAGKPSRARADIPATTEPAETDGAAAGSVDARGGDTPIHEPPGFDCPHWQLRHGLQQQGIPLPAVKLPPTEDDAFVNGLAAGA